MAIELYMEKASHAVQHNEQEKFRVSRKANVDCRDAIENGISEHYHNNRLDTSFAKDIIETYGMERVRTVVAGTIRVKDWDGRISRDNKAWAKEVEMPAGDGTEFRITQSHPGLLDLFCNRVRRIEQEQEKTSVLEKLSEPLPKTTATPKPKTQEL